MQKLEIKGGRKISGTIIISGSKNSTLPILASTILTNKKVTIKNIPIVKDVLTMVDLLSALGSTIKFDKKRNTLVEPYLPNHQIGIIHFAGKNNDEIRNNKNYISKVETVDGKIIDMKLRFNK